MQQRRMPIFSIPTKGGGLQTKHKLIFKISDCILFVGINMAICHIYAADI